MAAQFVSSLSHEFKTPLTAIRMFAEMLRMRPDSETELRESERLSRLVDNVLNFPKIEQGRRLYRLQPTSLDGVIDSVVKAARYPLWQAGFDLSVTKLAAAGTDGHERSGGRRNHQRYQKEKMQTSHSLLIGKRNLFFGRPVNS